MMVEIDRPAKNVPRQPTTATTILETYDLDLQFELPDGIGRMIRKLREPDKARRIRLPSLTKMVKIARETGQRIEITHRRDGSCTIVLDARADEPAVEIDTPEQLRRLI